MMLLKISDGNEKKDILKFAMIWVGWQPPLKSGYLWKFFFANIF